MLNVAIALIIFFNSIFALSVQRNDDTTLALNDHQNKKILLVNVASQSQYVNQLNDLQQLHQQYGDSVLIIAFPSNSFGNEPLSDSSLVLFFTNTYGVTFPVSKKSDVRGSNAHQVYEWLSNQVTEGPKKLFPGKDFQKFVINKNGELCGWFNSEVSPLDSSVIKVLTANF